MHWNQIEKAEEHQWWWKQKQQQHTGNQVNTFCFARVRNSEKSQSSIMHLRLWPAMGDVCNVRARCVCVWVLDVCTLCASETKRKKKSRNNKQNTTDRSMQSNESYTIGFVTSFDWLCIPDLTARAHRRLPRLEQSRKKEFFVLAKALTL